jgi:4-amino-4-deoxy-L-arabinose transferase-like glycosyltransferase
MLTLLPPGPRWLKSSRTEPLLAAEPSPGRICAWPWAALCVAIVAAMSLFYQLGSYRTFSSHEVYAVVPAREMIESGNWVFPTFGGLPRLRKPPLAYWMVAGSAKLCGELSPLTARLPSACAGLCLALVIGLWAKRWYGPPVGWTAVFVQLTSAWFLIFGRKAEVDMVLCLFTTAALFLIADQPSEETGRRSFFRWLGVYLLLSLAWLAKFHYGPAMVLFPVVVFFCVEGRFRQLKKLWHPLGLACFAGAVVIWPMLILEYAPNAWEVWRRETFGRAVGEMGRHALLHYVPFLIWLPLPWTPFAALCFRRSWRAAWSGRDSRERFLWIWLFAQLAIVTLSVNKHQNYLMALLPVFTLWAARTVSGLVQAFQEGRLQIPRPWLVPLIGANLLWSGLLLILLPMKWPELWGPALVLAVTLGLCEVAGWMLLYRRRLGAVMAVNLINVMIVGVVVLDWVLPHCDRRVEVQAFAKEIRQEVLPHEPVCVFRMDRDPLVYHLGSPVFRAESIGDLKPRLESDQPLYVIGYERFIKELGPIVESDPLARLPKGRKELEPVEGDLVLVRVRKERSLPSANAN